MNIFSILEKIEKADPEVYGRLDSRRKAMGQFADVGKKLTLATMPLALSAMFNKAYAQSSKSDVLDALQFALAAEHLEASFYAYGVAHAADLGMPDDIRQGFAKMTLDENAHIFLLRQTISELGSRPLRGGDTTVTNKDYGVDITGGGGSGNGPFAAATLNLRNYLMAAQPVSDLGVRAYKGQATRVMSNNYVLLRALDIHAVEARHASYIRFKRRYLLHDADITPWTREKNPYLTGSLAMAAQPVYEAGADPMKAPAEDNVMQGGVNITSLPGFPDRAASEAFDEPMDKAGVLNILGVPGSGMGSPNAKFFY